MQLDKSQIRHLKSLAHKRKPIVTVGHKGLSDNIIKESKIALSHHELVKMKISAKNRVLRDRIITELCEKTGAQCIQRIGGKAVFFLRNSKKTIVVFPD